MAFHELLKQVVDFASPASHELVEHADRVLNFIKITIGGDIGDEGPFFVRVRTGSGVVATVDKYNTRMLLVRMLEKRFENLYKTIEQEKKCRKRGDIPLYQT